MRIRQAAFIGNHAMLKGALHCHTTRSDGKGEPDEVIRYHKKNGYNFMALTDHRRYNYENFAPETEMLIIPGMEIDKNLPSEGGVHCFHTVVIGHEKENGNPYAQDQRVESGTVADQFEFQKDLDKYHAENQLTLYCHPEWSSTPAREFEKLTGNFGMEIWNSGCVIENEMDTNAAYWDELLHQGIHIGGVATDDGHAMYQHCRGWVRVNAEKNVESVLEALKNEAFYSSCGPEIYDFYVEDGQAVVECSPCAKIAFHSFRYPLPCEVEEKGTLTRLTCKLKDNMPYIRATVVDKDGNRAWTNPIYLK